MTGTLDVIQPAAHRGGEWSGLPSSGLRLNGVLRPASALPFLLPGQHIEVGTLVDDAGARATLCLVDSADRAAVAEQLAANREFLTGTVFVAVRGEEPALLVGPLRDAAAWAANAAHLHPLPAQAEDPSFYAPIVAAEASRANQGRLYFGGLHDTRTGFVFDYPLDEEAILAEFELGQEMTIAHTPYPTIVYSGIWGLGGASGPGGEEQELARAAWWTAWRAAPRPRVLLTNPFLGAGS
jgi:hypothetical protein